MLDQTRRSEFQSRWYKLHDINENFGLKINDDAEVHRTCSDQKQQIEIKSSIHFSFSYSKY